MKQFLLLIISFFMVPCFINAEEFKPYLTDLEITNGVNTLTFDKHNDLYTINVYEDVDALDISYKTEDSDTVVEIIGNELTNPINDVYINLDNDGKNNSYHLIVNKISDSKPVFLELSSNEPTKDNKLMQLLIVIGYVLINVLIFKILFHKKRIQ